MFAMRIIIIYVLSLFCVQMGAQDLTASQLFRQMPDSLLPYLSQGNRLDLIDFVESGMESKVTDGLDGSVRLTKLTTDYLMLELSQSSSLEMKLLPCEAGVFGDTVRSVVCVVMTVGTDVRESTVNFYTTGWHCLPSEGMIEPSLSVIASGMQPSDAVAKRMMSPRFLSARLSPDAVTINLTVSSFQSSQEEMDKKIPLEIQKTLKWNGKTFKEV